jgi:hypothetical protein
VEALKVGVLEAIAALELDGSVLVADVDDTAVEAAGKVLGV